jgi:hypothetical protein
MEKVIGLLGRTCEALDCIAECVEDLRGKMEVLHRQNKE